MSLQESLNRSPALKIGVLTAIGFVLIWSLYSQFGGTSEVKKAWFTTDDGKTYWTDDIKKIPPFQTNNKTAYGCEVFTCDEGKTSFVGFLVRFRPEAVAELAALGPPPKAGPELQEYLDRRNAIEIRTREVKRPLTGDAGWALARATPEGAAITTIKSPTPGGVVESVLP